MNPSEETPLEHAGDMHAMDPTRSHPAWLNWAVIGGVLLLLVLVFKVARPLMSRFSFDDPTDHPAVGRILHRIELAGLVDSEGELAAEHLHGQVVLINFWATWCEPCKKEMPHIARLNTKFAGDDTFRLLSVSYGPARTPEEADQLRAETAGFLAKQRLSLPVYCDPAGVTLNTYGELVTMGGGMEEPVLPTTVLLDREGVVRAVWVGYVDGVGIEDQMRDQIAELLKTPVFDDGADATATDEVSSPEVAE